MRTALSRSSDEDLAVADLAGLGRGGDGFDDFVDLVGSDCDLNLELRQEAHGVFGAAIDFGVPLLTPVSLDLSDGHAVHPDRGQGVTDLVELEWLYDGHDDFHLVRSPLARRRLLRLAGVSTRAPAGKDVPHLTCPGEEGIKPRATSPQIR